MFYVPESEVWSALQVYLFDNGDSPPVKEPEDKSYIQTLIYAAQERFDKFAAIKLADIEGEVPVSIKLAIFTDISTHYFNRMNPSLPDAYWDAITPYRAWSFGGAVENSDA